MLKRYIFSPAEQSVGFTLL